MPLFASFHFNFCCLLLLRFSPDFFLYHKEDWRKNRQSGSQTSSRSQPAFRFNESASPSPFFGFLHCDTCDILKVCFCTVTRTLFSSFQLLLNLCCLLLCLLPTRLFCLLIIKKSGKKATEWEQYIFLVLANFSFDEFFLVALLHGHFNFCSTSAASSHSSFPFFFAYYKEEWEEGNGVGAIHLLGPSQLDNHLFGSISCSTSIIVTPFSCFSLAW